MRIAALSSAGAALLIGISMIPYGLGMTPDSVHYLSAAENLRRGLGYATSVVPWNGPFPQPVAAWPPLYPVVLAAATALGGVTTGPWVLNALLLAASTWQVTRLSGPAPLLGALAFLVSPAVVSVHSYAWSEPLFLALVLLALRGQERLLEEPGAKWLAIAAGATALACMTRYLGVALVLSGAITLLASRRRLLGLAYAGLSVTPLGLWLLRNYGATGTLAGNRTAGGRELSELIREVATTLGGWLVPVNGFSLRILALLALLAVVVVLALRSGLDRADLPYAAFAVVYLATVLAAARSVHFDPLTTRLLAPLVPPLAVLAARRSAAVPGPERRAMAAALALLLVAGPALVMARDLAHAMLVTKGRGYRAARWRETDAVRLAALGQGPFSGKGTIYSDAPDVLALYSGRPVRYLPEEGTDLGELSLQGSAIVLVGVNPTLPNLIDPTGSPLFRVERTLGRGAVLLPAGELP